MGKIISKISSRYGDIKYWVMEQRLRMKASPTWQWWSGVGYAYWLAGALQAAVFSKTVIGLTLATFIKFALIWPLWSFAVVTEDRGLGTTVLEFVFDMEMEEPVKKKHRPAKKMPV